MSLLSITKKILGGQAATPAAQPLKDQREANAPAAKQQAPAGPETSAPLAPGRIAGAINLRPLVTEKSMTQPGTMPVVAFRVNIGANKRMIAAAVAERYQIQPVAVRTMVMMPKVRRRGRTEGRTPMWKKAYVTLPEGKAIDLGV